jgi:hypothetical protein
MAEPDEAGSALLGLDFWLQSKDEFFGCDVGLT